MYAKIKNAQQKCKYHVSRYIENASDDNEEQLTGL